jgi:magnesium-transporting ATPase (P-type)
VHGGDTERARQVNDEMSRKALRVLAVAVREIDALPEVLAPESWSRTSPSSASSA